MIRLPFLRLPVFLASMALATAGAQEQTARLVKDGNRMPGYFRANIGWVMPAGKGVVFPQDTLAQGSELWFSDGTPRGTRLLVDLLPGPGGSNPENPVAFGTDGKVAFNIDPGFPPNELWVTDGTAAGTVRLAESPVPGYAGETVALAGTDRGVFFESRIWDLESPAELRFSDGTAAGTWSLNPLEGESRARFSNPSGYVASGPWCYFIANQHEVWRSDGSEAGTTKVLTVTAGTPERLALAGDRLFVAVAADARELWSCPMDGGELTRLGAPEGTTWQEIRELVGSGNEVFFMVEGEDEHGIYTGLLWASDGTAAGTRRIPLAVPGQGAASTLTGTLTPWNGATYFLAQGNDVASELWRTDGTSTMRVATFPRDAASLFPHGMPPGAEHLYFPVWREHGRWDLWQTRGDAASTRPVRGTPTINPNLATGPALASGATGIFFAAGQDTPDEALWRTRGTNGGALRLTRPEKSTGWNLIGSSDNAPPYEMLGGKLLAFIDTGRSYELWRMNPDGSRARSIWMAPEFGENKTYFDFRAVIGGTAVFTFSGRGTNEVWATDGTRRGTRLLARFQPGSGISQPHQFVQAGGVWFFSVLNEYHGERASLWKTDGTPAGTTEVVAADGTVPSPDAWEMVSFQGRLHFLSTGKDLVTSLWRSDGTAAGTVRVTDESWQRNAKSLSAVGERLVFFVRWDNNDPHGLWTGDGTAEGTTEVLPPQYFSSWYLYPPVDLGGVAIFQSTRNWGPVEWWRHDATGTRPVRDSQAGPAVFQWHHGSRHHAVAGGRLFYAVSENYDSQLWVTDGTADGTRLVKRISRVPVGWVADHMLTVGDDVYFAASDAYHGEELWRSDGTEAGTVRVADIEPGPGGSSPQGLKVMDGKLYFSAERRDVGRELFVIDLPPP